MSSLVPRGGQTRLSRCFDYALAALFVVGLIALLAIAALIGVLAEAGL